MNWIKLEKYNVEQAYNKIYCPFIIFKKYLGKIRIEENFLN